MASAKILAAKQKTIDEITAFVEDGNSVVFFIVV